MTEPTVDDVEALRQWFATRPEPAAVRALAARFNVRNPGAVTREQLIRLAAAEHPDALPDLLSPIVAADPLERPLYAAAGEALGVACAKRKVASPGGSYANLLQLATVEAQGAYLRDAVAVIHAYEVQCLGAWLAPRADALPAWVKRAYAAALIGCVPRAQKHERSSLFPFTALLDAAEVEQLLRASAKQAGLFELALARAAEQGFPQCADGVAALLADEKLGRVAATALATMGDVGVAAAERVLQANSATPAAVELARTIVSLPPPPFTLWAGQQRSMPRFGRDPSVDLRPRSATDAPARKEPTALAAIERAVTERPGADLLTPDGWADLLQIVALDPHLADVPGAYERALRAGRLGRGADPDALTAALDELRWDAAITRHYPASEWGVGWALLWAGADRSVFRHAVARCEIARVVDVLGMRERHFSNPLKELRPPWAPTVEALLKHYGANRHETAWQGLPALLAALDAPAAEVELAAPSPDLWINGRVQGARRFTLRFRRDVIVTVDVDAERWTVTSPNVVSGATPPLDPDRGVRFSVEVARNGMYVGIDGAVIHGAFMGLPMEAGPVRVVAEGEGATVVELELRAKYTVRASEAAFALISGLDTAQGYTDVAGLRSASAAHALAAAAMLLDEPGATLARNALLTMGGDEAEPWRRHLGDAGGTPAAATAFTVRSFEDVVRVLHDLKLGAKARGKKPVVLRRGQTQRDHYEYASFAPKPETEDWGARKAVPFPAVYLSEEPAPLDNVTHFGDALSRLPCLCRKGRGAHARVSYCVDDGNYLVASLELVDGGDDSYGWFDVMAAAWRVDEGWCWAMLEGNDEPLRALMGVAALPPQVEWKSADRVVIGDW